MHPTPSRLEELIRLTNENLARNWSEYFDRYMAMVDESDSPSETKATVSITPESLEAFRETMDEHIQNKVDSAFKPVPGEMCELVRAPAGPCRVTVYVRSGDQSYDVTYEGPDAASVVEMYEGTGGVW